MITSAILSGIDITNCWHYSGIITLSEKENPLGFFIIYAVAKHRKIEGGPLGLKNSHNAGQKLKRETLWVFSLSMLSQNIEKLKGDPLAEKETFSKKSHNAKKLKGRPFRLPVLYVPRKKKNFFLVQFARPNDSIWDHKIS